MEGLPECGGHSIRRCWQGRPEDETHVRYGWQFQHLEERTIIVVVIVVVFGVGDAVAVTGRAVIPCIHVES